ncbi:hypothetical protein NDU88_001972 [Pleurodeles waltl]|uniref:Uncharacterized protein n=1 Tax=Pleurodeles waltl TaxID=8319 RepID=A0AAV7SAA8_PLEWA|nr:hypothetical protein NDU88_001972 [Pleurodeles waltl]
MRAEGGAQQTKTSMKEEEKMPLTAVDRKTLAETQSPAPAVREAPSANSGHAWGKAWPPQVGGYPKLGGGKGVREEGKKGIYLGGGDGIAQAQLKGKQMNGV